MLARVFKILRGVIGGALMLIGLAVVALVWWLSGSSEKASEVEQIAQPVVASCDCASGATCTGPRGGRYCLDGAGKKRYLARDKSVE